MDDQTAWAKVGELGFVRLVASPDPSCITFGELAEKYLADYPFKKKSTKDLYQQVIRNVLMPTCTDAIAISINPSQLKSWLLKLDVSNCNPRNVPGANVAHLRP